MPFHIGMPTDLCKAQLIINLCLITFLVAMTSCDRGEPQNPKSRSPVSPVQDAKGESSNQEADEATLTYGYAPTPNPSVKYQPEVVFVEGGPQIIRSVSADGMIWTIDRQAKGAKDLRVGSVMLATARAAGRVLRLEDRGENLAVTLGPAKLGEFVRDANVAVDVDIKPESIGYQYIPELRNKYRNLQSFNFPSSEFMFANASDTINVVLPPVLLAVSTETNELPKVLKVESLKIKVDEWELEPYFRRIEADNTHRLGLKIERGINDSIGLKIAIDFNFLIHNLHWASNLVYRDGRPDEAQTDFLLSGIEGFEVSLISGAENPFTQNKHIRIEVPVEFVTPIATGSIPLVAQIKLKFVLQTMLGGKNATLSAGGGYTIKGTIGIQKGKPVVPVIEQKGSIVDSVQGISLMPSALILAVETRSLLGLGTSNFMAGPYARLVTTATVTHGSALAPMFQCARASIKFDVGTGVGWQTSLLDFLKSIDPGFSFTSGEIADNVTTVLQKEYFLPDIARCH